jgi:hypothetical protein
MIIIKCFMKRLGSFSLTRDGDYYVLFVSKISISYGEICILKNLMVAVHLLALNFLNGSLNKH